MTAEPPENGICRITVDIDSYVDDWQFSAVRAVHNARAAGAVQVNVRISSSGRGIHLIIWFDEFLHPETKQRLREQWGDDPNRIAMDDERGRHNHTTNVLWTQKGDDHAQTDLDGIWHALETIETAHRDLTTVPKSFANHGRKAVGRLAYPERTPAE